MSSLRRCPRVVAVLFLFCLSVSSTAIAQGTGDLVGRVTDNSGAVLPGATVTITNEGTGNVRTGTTTEGGDYTFNLLPIGIYTVKIELPGFQTHNARVTLATGDRLRVDARLQVGSLAESIVVTGEAPLLQTDTASIGVLITEKAVQDLPVDGRNITRLVQLVPGAHEGAVSSLANGTRPDDRRQTSSISINGARDTWNNNLIDGVDNNERSIGTVGVKPSMDAIAEVKVQTNLYAAEYGRTVGGVVNIITKSGTNQLHGSAFEFFRDGRFDERNYFATTDPDTSLHQFGGSLGGPIARNRTFFFGDYEGYRQDNSVVNVITVPTAKMRAGDFSEISQIIYDPLTSPARTPFQGNIIPSQRIDPLAARMVALYPMPNAPGLVNNYNSTTNRSQDSTTADARVDHRFSDADSLFARYSYNLVDTFSPGACPLVNVSGQTIDPVCVIAGVGGGGAFPGPNHTNVHSMQTNYVRVINPTLIGDVKFGYLNLNIESLPANHGTNAAQTLGIPNANIDEMASALTLFSITGYAFLGDQTAIPLILKDKTYQVSGSLTKTAGSHNIKMGAGFIDRAYFVIQPGSPSGTFTFDTALTRNAAGQGGNGLASLLLGYPSNAGRGYSFVKPEYNTVEPSFYIQDDWRATSWLTVNVGLRYDVYTPLTESEGHIASFSLDTLSMQVPGQKGVGDTAGVETDYSNFAPRLGFSASLPRSMVVRGGYGLSYFPSNVGGPSQMRQPPWTSSYTPITNLGVSNGVPTVFLKDGFPLPVPNSAETADLTGGVGGVATDFQSTRVHQFNILLEKEFAGNVVQAGYLGQRTGRLSGGAGGGGRPHNIAPMAHGNIQPRRRYASALPNVTGIGILESNLDAWYDAVQFAFQRRFRAGFALTTHYSFSQADESAWKSWSYEFDKERGPSGLDINHRYVLTAGYELPWLRSRGGLVGGIFGGWQVNTSAFYQTGLPFDVSNATARCNCGGNDRPNMIGDPELPGDERTLQRWFNTTAFDAQPQNSAGDTPRNVLHGPPNRRLDLSFLKNVGLRGARQLQFRWEIYNITNTASFGNPASAFGNQQFGIISNTANNIPRQMQFAVKYVF